MDAARPQFKAYPLGSAVGLHVDLWYADFSASMSPNEARMLAIHLINAAEDAESSLLPPTELPTERSISNGI